MRAHNHEGTCAPRVPCRPNMTKHTGYKTTSLFKVFSSVSILVFDSSVGECQPIFSYDGTSCNLRSITSVSHQRDVLAGASWDRGYETTYTSSDSYLRTGMNSPDLFSSDHSHRWRIPSYIAVLYCMLLENSMMFAGALLSSPSQHLSLKTARPSISCFHLLSLEHVYHARNFNCTI